GAARALGGAPHVEERGPGQDRVAEPGDRVAVAERGGQRHRGAVRAAARRLDHHRPARERVGHARVLVAQELGGFALERGRQLLPPRVPERPPRGRRPHLHPPAVEALAPPYTRARSKRSSSHSAAEAGTGRRKCIRSSKSSFSSSISVPQSSGCFIGRSSLAKKMPSAPRFLSSWLTRRIMWTYG